jgi:hypothetical protein
MLRFKNEVVMEKLIFYGKMVFSWFVSIVIFLSFALNLFFAGIVWADRQQLTEMDEHLRYKDSIQLHLMDKLVDENNIRK